MQRWLQWFRENLKNDDIISALSGDEVKPPFYDPDRKLRTTIWTLVGYFSVCTAFLVLSSLMPEAPERNRDLPGLIFVMKEGPGGGGGGGGEESLAHPSIQELQGDDDATIAVKLEEPEEELIFDDPDAPELEEEKEEEVEEEDEIPEIVAPVVAQAPDDIDQKGLLHALDQLLESTGAGRGDGSGTGEGTGIGEGQGSGIGEGAGGGYGGGAYRMGSRITSPVLLQQVSPTFTDDALARKVEGEVIVEVVILKDGTVRPVRIVQSLASDLDRKAIDAAAQWKFIPGKFMGKPVDVIAEIVVSFNIL
jgi:TonB family protein